MYPLNTTTQAYTSPCHHVTLPTCPLNLLVGARLHRVRASPLVPMSPRPLVPSRVSLALNVPTCQLAPSRATHMSPCHLVPMSPQFVTPCHHVPMSPCPLACIARAQRANLLTCPLHYELTLHSDCPGILIDILQT